MSRKDEVELFLLFVLSIRMEYIYITMNIQYDLVFDSTTRLDEKLYD